MRQHNRNLGQQQVSGGTGVKRVLFYFPLIALLAACQQQPAELSQADKDAVKAMVDKYVQAAIAADWDKWGTTLSDDIYYSPPNLAPMTGRQAVVVWAKTFPKITNLMVTVDVVAGRGDVAYARGSYTLNLVLPGGAAMTEHGTFLDIHRRGSDGTWPYTHLMYHSTDPVPVAPAPKRQ